MLAQIGRDVTDPQRTIRGAIVRKIARDGPIKPGAESLVGLKDRVRIGIVEVVEAHELALCTD